MTALETFILTSNTCQLASADRGDFVELGIGRFKMNGPVIDEPLAFCSIAARFGKSVKLGQCGRLVMELDFAQRAQVLGLTYERVLALAVLRCLDESPKRLDQLFDLKGEIVPPWWNQTVHAVTNDGGDNWLPAGISRGSSPCSVKVAQSHEDVTSWLENQRGVPILQPDENMGPDLLFHLKTEDGHVILVAMQAKLRSKKVSVEEALRTVSRSQFYVQNRSSKVSRAI